MFLDIAVAAIGIGVVVMVGYLVVYNVRTALPLTAGTQAANDTIAGIDSAQTTVFAGFALVAVGIIVLAAFGLISVFK
jgi:riboflavin transporter FmnP